MKQKSHGGKERPVKPIDLEILRDTPPWDWPKDAGKTFQSTLANRAAPKSDRLIAAELAGDLVVVNDALCDALLDVLSDNGEPEKLRGAAAIALGPVLEHADTFGFEDDPDEIPITEGTFHRIQVALQKLYLDDSIPKSVRRRILEASVRSTQDWHKDAIGKAYSSGDADWMLTAVFCMRWVPGFDGEILEALKSSDSKIRYEAVTAAGNWELDAVWPHLVELVEDPFTPKKLLLAAIGAVASIRPAEAGEILIGLMASEDPEIVEAADEAILEARSFAEGGSVDEEEDDESEWIN